MVAGCYLVVFFTNTGFQQFYTKFEVTLLTDASVLQPSFQVAVRP